MGKDLTAEGIAVEQKKKATEAFERLHTDGANRFGMSWLQAHMVVSGVVDEEYVSEDSYGNTPAEVKAVIADVVFRLLERYLFVPRSNRESERLLMSEFMNLVQACEMKGVAFEPVDGVSLEYCHEVINGHFKELGYSEERIKSYWSGENQLVSS